MNREKMALFMIVVIAVLGGFAWLGVAVRLNTKAARAQTGASEVAGSSVAAKDAGDPLPAPVSPPVPAPVVTSPSPQPPAASPAPSQPVKPSRLTSAQGNPVRLRTEKSTTPQTGGSEVAGSSVAAKDAGDPLPAPVSPPVPAPVVTSPSPQPPAASPAPSQPETANALRQLCDGQHPHPSVDDFCKAIMEQPEKPEESEEPEDVELEQPEKPEESEEPEDVELTEPEGLEQE